METPKHFYGKIHDIIYDSECLIQSLPIAVGGPHHSDCAKSSYKSLMKYTTLKVIDISSSNKFYSNLINTNEYPIKQKIILSNCTRIQPFLLILFFDSKDNTYKIRTLAQCFINGIVYASNSIIQMHSYDNIAINCQECRSDHIYLLTLAPHHHNCAHDIKLNATQMLNPFGDSNMNVGLPEIIQSDLNRKFIGLLKEPNKKQDEALSKKWTSYERECLQKYLITFGYDRWDVIRDNSDKVLSDKKDLELKVFSLAFIKRIIELLPQHKKGELKTFLIDFVHDNENEDEPFIDYKNEDWGTLINSKAVAWGKRIQFLHKVKVIVEKFAKENKKNNELRKALNNDNIVINTKYDVWSNMLNFLPDSALCEHKPTNWWTKMHDVDLLRGIYKHGYANYTSMKEDSELAFFKLYNLPSSNSMTRRFKRLMHIIIRRENEKENSNEHEHEDTISKDTNGLSLDEKQKIITYLINYGIPINNNESDWSTLKAKLIDKHIIPKDNNEGRTISPQMLEVFILQLQTISHQITNKTFNEIDHTNNYNDDFSFVTYEQANTLTTRLTQMNFIRQNMHNISSSHKSSLFEQGLKELTKLTKSGKSQPEACKEAFWQCDKHDKHLLIFILDHGFIYINEHINHHPDFKHIQFTPNDYITRIEFLYQFYSKLKHNNNATPVHPHNKHKEIRIINGKKEIKVEQDDEGNFKYPIKVSGSLTILNLGKIEHKREQYHTKNNLFPIGYTIQREAGSMYEKGKKVSYICEILDNGDKPKYRITCKEPPYEIIERTSSTACWLEVTTRIKELNNPIPGKVTISGPDRFGLCDNVVVQLLQKLPNARKCTKYIKYNK